MADDRGKVLTQEYLNGGASFLAPRLSRIFVRIEKGDDKARELHNDMVDDVMVLINRHPEVSLSPQAALSFLHKTAEYLLRHTIDGKQEEVLRRNLEEELKGRRRNRFFCWLAGIVTNLASTKGQ